MWQVHLEDRQYYSQSLSDQSLKLYNALTSWAKQGHLRRDMYQAWACGTCQGSVGMGVFEWDSCGLPEDDIVVVI